MKLLLGGAEQGSDTVVHSRTCYLSSRIDLPAVVTTTLSEQPRLKLIRYVQPSNLQQTLLSARKTWQRNWCKRELGEDVPVITCMSRDKHTYCRPGNVLIDDRYVRLDLSPFLPRVAAGRWCCASSVGVLSTHTCPNTTPPHATAVRDQTYDTSPWLLRLPDPTLPPGCRWSLPGYEQVVFSSITPAQARHWRS